MCTAVAAAVIVVVAVVGYPAAEMMTTHIAYTVPSRLVADVGSSPSDCFPLTNGGNCYEPGEFCRNSDHGKSGLAGNSTSIVCENNDGWRWEPVAS